MALILLSGFVFSYLLSALLAVDIKRALFVLVFTIFVVLIALSVSVSWGPVSKKYVDRSLLIITWVVVLFGFYQYFGDLLGFSTAVTGLRDLYTKNVFGFPRIQSTGLEPLYYANFLLLPLFYFGAKFINGDDEQPYLITLIATQIVLTVSRGALIAGVVGVVLLLIMTARRSRYTQGIGFLGLTILGLALALNLSNLNFRKNDNQNQPQPQSQAQAVVSQATNLVAQDDRVRNRSLAWSSFMQSPILGIGPGNFNQYARSQFPVYGSLPGYLIVNNEPLELLSEAGIIGFILFIGFIGLLFWRIARMAWKEGASEAGIWPVAITAYLVAMAIQYQTFSTLYIMHLWVVIGIALAITTPGLQSNKLVVESAEEIDVDLIEPKSKHFKKPKPSTKPTKKNTHKSSKSKRKKSPRT
ncbi:MAG: O-antigen ligase family protein [bacterium]